MNDTPRTDANDLGWQFNEQHGDFDSLSDNPMPWLDFAKMLERELTTVTEQRDRLADQIEANHKGTLMLERMVYQSREQRDRLALVLQRIRDGYGGQVASPNCCEDCDFLIPIDEALQSLTPNELCATHQKQKN